MRDQRHTDEQWPTLHIGAKSLVSHRRAVPHRRVGREPVHSTARPYSVKRGVGQGAYDTARCQSVQMLQMVKYSFNEIAHHFEACEGRQTEGCSAASKVLAPIAR